MSFDYRTNNDMNAVRNIQGSTLSPASGYHKIDNGPVHNRRNIKGSSSFAGQNIGDSSRENSSEGDNDRPVASINPNDGCRS